MRLLVLGSGSCELRPDRSSPSYLVEAGSSALMLDLGQGAWRRLLETGRDPADINGILLSHHHLDHISDLLPFLFALNYDPHLENQPVKTLMAHQGFSAVLEGLEGVFGDWIKPGESVLKKKFVLPGAEILMGDILVRTAGARHMDTSLAFRLESGGASLVYLGDSEPCPELTELSRQADLLLVHAASPDARPKPGHMTPAGAGRMAARAGVGSLVLSHLYRDVDPEEAVASACKFFSGPVYAARDHMALEHGPRGFKPVPHIS